MADGNAASAAPRAEQEALVATSSSPQGKGKIRSFLDFLYDKRTGKVLGRTGLSWLEITVFYIIFYAGLIGFWAICLAVFVQTLDPKFPTWYGKGSIIGINPGMGYQPWMQKDPESTLIMFNVNDEETYKKYTEQMKKFLEKRYGNTTGTRDCADGDSNRDDNEESCRVNVDTDFGDCTEANDFGFKDGKPCVAISINRLVAWEPVAYPKGSAPQPIKDGYEGDAIPIHCDGEYYSDQENIGKLTYSPKKGLAFKYYPYKVMDNYHQPIVMVKFESLRRGVLVEVECKAYAYNIIHDTADRQGMVHFEILVDDLPKKEEGDEEAR